MRRVRVIPVLLLADGGLSKPKGFNRARYLGDPINAVKIFNEKVADELVLLDIEATSRGSIDFDWIGDIVSEAFMPVAYGGGLSSLEDCARVFELGVEKVVINTAAVERPELISEISNRFGAQAVIVSIDAKRNVFGRWRAFTRGGRKEARFSPAELAQAAVQRGAGEIMVTSIPREGTFKGYDLDLLRAVCDSVSVPVIAHGGAGKVEHFVEAIARGGASAVAAGSMFVFAGEGEGVLISYPSPDELQAQFWRRVAA